MMKVFALLLSTLVASSAVLSVPLISSLIAREHQGPIFTPELAKAYDSLHYKFTAVLGLLCGAILLSYFALKFTFGAITAPEREMFWIELLRSLQWDFILILSGVDIDGAPSGKAWLLWLLMNGVVSCSTRLLSVRLQMIPTSPMTHQHYKYFTALFSSTFAIVGALALSWPLIMAMPVSMIVLWCSPPAFVLLNATHVLIRFHIEARQPPMDAAVKHFTDAIIRSLLLCVSALQTCSVAILCDFDLFPCVLMLLRLSTLYGDSRALFLEHNNFIALAQRLETLCPAATDSELHALDDVCSVCREGLTEARRLPCGHFLHIDCLRQWLLQQPSCPVCRAEIKGLRAPLPQRQRMTPLFPTFMGHPTRAVVRSVDDQVRAVLEMFPHASPTAVRADLLLTQNVERTIDHVLEQPILFAAMEDNFPASYGALRGGVAAPTAAAAPVPAPPAYSPADHSGASSSSWRPPFREAVSARDVPAEFPAEMESRQHQQAMAMTESVTARRALMLDAAERRQRKDLDTRAV